MRWKALLDLPMGTQVGRAFQGADGVSRAVLGQVYDSQVPYWRVEYPGGDWEELSRREMTTWGSRCRNIEDKEADPPRRQQVQGNKTRKVVERRARLLPGTPALGGR